MKSNSMWIPFFSLFTSMSTLVCCALPALLVSIGLGATMVGLVSTFPALIILSENKLLVFSISFIMLGISSYMQYRAQFLPCPIDANAARACTTARLWSKRVTIFSIVVWTIGASFALLPLILSKF